MKSVINYFIKYPVVGNLLMFALILSGVIGLQNMQRTFFPETESRFISIQTVYPGASPEEIEEGIVLKIEENLKGVTGIERVSSVSSENSGIVTVEVMKGYDTDRVLQDVKNEVDRISSFPAAMEPPTVFKQENLSFAISFALSGDVDLATLKRFGRQVEDELRAVEGISKVTLGGFPEEEIAITFREKDLEAYGMSFQEAVNAVRNNNVDITGGTIKGPKEELLIRARNKRYEAEALRNIPLRSNPNGSLILLYQVADVAEQWSATNPSRTFLNGKPAVTVQVQNTLEEDILFITNYVKDYIKAFNEQNEAVQITIIRDGSVNLNQRIDLLLENGLLGFLIVLLTLALFLNWRIAFWVAISIPISFAGMFLVGAVIGLTINVVSLFGMILVVGILVDDGIVISENIYQYYEKGMSPVQAATLGTLNVLPSVFSAVATTVIAFTTFYFVDGRLGEIFSDLSTVVILSLLFSLVEGALVLPGHVAHSKALAQGMKKNRVAEALDRFMYWMRDTLYAPALRFSLRHRLIALALPIALFIFTIGGLASGTIRFTFFPIIPRDNIDATLKMPSGTREDLTLAMLDRVEAAAWEVNEDFKEKYFGGQIAPINFIEKSVGPSTFDGRLNINLIDGETRDSITAGMIGAAIRRKLGPLPEVEALSLGNASIFGKPVSISLLGNDYKQLSEVIDRVKAELEQMPELRDVIDNNQEGLREVNLRLNEKGRYLGLSLQDVLAQVRAGFFGAEIQRLQRGRDEVRVWVRYEDSDRANIGKLETMRIRFADGREFPLAEIADLEMGRGVVAINHIDGKREIKVEADVSSDKIDVPVVLGKIRSEIVPPILKDYPGVSVLYEGQNREQEKSAQSIQRIGPLILGLMLLSIILTFRSVSQALVVFSLIPFGLVGVGWGHWFMGAPISFFSVLGIIALIGILVNDALVFVAAYNDNIKAGLAQMDAIYEAGLSRFRPILLTTVTTVAGLAPLMAEKSFQAQFLIPMAISVSYGLLVITFLTLIMLPVLLVLANRVKVYATWAWEGRRPDYEVVEPHYNNGERFSQWPVWLLGVLLSTAAFVGVLMLCFRIVGAWF